MAALAAEKIGIHAIMIKNRAAATQPRHGHLAPKAGEQVVDRTYRPRFAKCTSCGDQTIGTIATEYSSRFSFPELSATG